MYNITQIENSSKSSIFLLLRLLFCITSYSHKLLSNESNALQLQITKKSNELQHHSYFHKITFSTANGTEVEFNWHQKKNIWPPKTCSNIPRDGQLAAWWWLNRIFLKMEALLWLNGKSQNRSVAKGWLFTKVCCCESAIHTMINSGRKWTLRWWLFVIAQRSSCVN